MPHAEKRNAHVTTATNLPLIHEIINSRSTRDRFQLFFAEGIRNFLYALEHNWSIHSLIVSNRLLTSGLARSKVRVLKRQGQSILRVSPEEFRTISGSRRASGIAMLVHYRLSSDPSELIASCRSWLVMESIQSLGNLGTLLRTSDAIGGCGLIMIGPQIDPFSPDIVRATVGSLFRQHFFRLKMKQLKRWVNRNHLQVIGASPEGRKRYFDCRYQFPTLIVLGHETRGVSPQLRDLCTNIVRIPMQPGRDSLNVSVAGSLLMYETIRQNYSTPISIE